MTYLFIGVRCSFVLVLTVHEMVIEAVNVDEKSSVY